MTYSPHTEADRARMLDAVGVASVDDLFDDIPTAVRAGPWSVPPPLVEQEVRAELARLAGRNRIPEVSFLGAGVYRHLIPSVVGEVIGRPKFATSYTPYQPEARTAAGISANRSSTEATPTASSMRARSASVCGE